MSTNVSAREAVRRIRLVAHTHIVPPLQRGNADGGCPRPGRHTRRNVDAPGCRGGESAVDQVGVVPADPYVRWSLSIPLNCLPCLVTLPLAARLNVFTSH